MSLNFSEIKTDLAEVFQNDRDVHVDDNKEADDEIRDEESDREHALATVSIRPIRTRCWVAPDGDKQLIVIILCRNPMTHKRNIMHRVKS